MQGILSNMLSTYGIYISKAAGHMYDSHMMAHVWCFLIKLLA